MSPGASTCEDRLNAAKDLVSVLPEGREMLSFLDTAGYSIEVIDDRYNMGSCHPDKKKIYFSDELTANQIAAFLPHEMFHGIQFENSPSVLNFYNFFVAENGPSLPVPQDGVVRLLKPQDFFRALMLMEMAAYAVGTDFVCKLADRGYHGPQIASEKSNNLTRTYKHVTGLDGARYIGAEGYTFAGFGDGVLFLPGHKAAFAKAAVAYHWFFGLSIERTNQPVRFHYYDQMAYRVMVRCKHKTAPYFSALARGVRFEFIDLDRETAVELGKGCGDNPLDMPGFEDIMSPTYRDCISEENERRFAAINEIPDLSSDGAHRQNQTVFTPVS